MESNIIYDLYSEKREYLIDLLKDYVRLYIKTFVLIKNSKVIRKDLTNLIKDYVNFDKLETKVLNNLIVCKDETVFNEILEELNEMFFRIFKYNEYVLNGYEEMFEMNDVRRAVVPKKDFRILEKSIVNDYINKIRNS